MSELLRGIVVGHGAVAAALVEAAEHISGVRGAVVPVSNTGCDRGALEARIVAAVGDGPAVVFVDLAAGSCLLATLHRLHERKDIPVVTGVNLAMLIEFLFHRDLPAAEAANRAAATGTRAIRMPA